MMYCSPKLTVGKRNNVRLFAQASLSVAVLGLALINPASAQIPVLTQNGGNARTGANLAETTLTQAAVSSGNFGKLFTITGLNANVNGQPLYVPRVTINNTLRNVLIAYTSNNSNNSACGLYAFDADSGLKLWTLTFPNSAQYTTATPVIDDVTDTIYVLTKSAGPYYGNGDTDIDDGQTFLHAVNLVTGQELAGSPARVTATAQGTGDGAYVASSGPYAGKYVVSLDGPATKVTHGGATFHANDRVGLLLVNGTIYCGFAFNSDANPYHGWVLGYSYNGSAFTQQYVFCTTPNGTEATTPGGADGGVWQAGKGLTADQSGNIYFTVGNGTFDANSGGSDYGMSFMKLGLNLTVEDYFSPYDEQTQSNQDLDTGNSGISGIPGTTSLFGGGTKFGSAFLLDSNEMGGFTPGGPDNILDRISGVSGNSNVGQNSVVWNSGDGAEKYIYLWPSGEGVEQFDYSPATGNLNPQGIAKQNTSLTRGGSLAVSANGGSDGIVWAAGNNGTLYALNATDVSQAPLWSGSFGSPGHFQFPTVTNGKVYVPTGSSSIVVYGLLNPPLAAGDSVITQVRYAPRTGFESRMLGGEFQGSDDNVNYTTLETVKSTPKDGLTNTLVLHTRHPYRYVRYLAPNSGSGNIAELEFDGGYGGTPVKLVGSPFGTPGSWNGYGNNFANAFDGDPTTFFDAPNPGNGDFVGLDLGLRSTLLPGQFLVPEQYLSSPNGAYFLVMQADGNLVLNAGSNPQNHGARIWNSGYYNEKGNGQVYTILQSDGNLVTYAGVPGNPGQVLWSSGTSGQTVTSLQVSNTPEVQLLNGTTVVWQKP